MNNELNPNGCPNCGSTAQYKNGACGCGYIQPAPKKSQYLVATKEKQGVRSNDFSYADEGHIATFGSVCDRATVDDKCGCKRAMVTPSNAKATTTVKVVELTEAEQRQALAEILNHFTKGWGFPEDQAVKMATDELNQNRDIASGFELGSVLEIRGNKVQTR